MNLWKYIDFVYYSFKALSGGPLRVFQSIKTILITYLHKKDTNSKTFTLDYRGTLKINWDDTRFFVSSNSRSLVIKNVTKADSAGLVFLLADINLDLYLTSVYKIADYIRFRKIQISAIKISFSDQVF